MVSLQTPICDFGWKAPDFDLPGVDGKRYRLADVVGPNGLLLMFICNHCPYVKAVRNRIVRDAKELLAHGILAQGDIDQVRAAVETEIADGLKFAEAGRNPDPAEVMRDVYTLEIVP